MLAQPSLTHSHPPPVIAHVQLVEDIYVLFQKEDTLDEHRSGEPISLLPLRLPIAHLSLPFVLSASALMKVIPFTAGQPSKSAFSASIQERASAIRAVLSRLSAIAPQSQSPEVSDLQARCHQLTDEVSDFFLNLDTLLLRIHAHLHPLSSSSRRPPYVSNLSRRKISCQEQQKSLQQLSTSCVAQRGGRIDCRVVQYC